MTRDDALEAASLVKALAQCDEFIVSASEVGASIVSWIDGTGYLAGHRPGCVVANDIAIEALQALRSAIVQRLDRLGVVL